MILCVIYNIKDNNNDVGKIFELSANNQESNADTAIENEHKKQGTDKESEMETENRKEEFENEKKNTNKNIEKVNTKENVNENDHINNNKNENDTRNDMAEYELPDKFRLKNALIGIIGIEKYDDFPNLDGIKNDYKNIIETFVKTYKYKTLYQLSDDNNNEIVYSNNMDEILSKQNFKLKWSEDDIYLYSWQLRKHLIEYKHDALLLFIGCHGNIKNEILTSDCDPYDIPTFTSYFKQDGGTFFDDQIDYKEIEKKSPYLLRIPKIFFVDMCRGKRRAKPESLIMNDDDNGDGKSNQDNNNNNNNNGTRIYRGISNDEEKKITGQDANVCMVYGNTNGYAVLGGSEGSQFTSVVCQVFDDTLFVELNNLTKIIREIRKKTKQKTANIKALRSIQIVETVDTMEREVLFNTPDDG